MHRLGVSAWIYGDAPLDVESIAQLRAHGLGVPPGVLAG
jgi:hypothetical protein